MVAIRFPNSAMNPPWATRSMSSPEASHRSTPRGRNPRKTRGFLQSFICPAMPQKTHVGTAHRLQFDPRIVKGSHLLEQEYNQATVSFCDPQAQGWLRCWERISRVARVGFVCMMKDWEQVMGGGSK